MRKLGLGLGLNGRGGGSAITPVLSLTIVADNLDETPPTILLSASADGTVTWDFDTSSTPPAAGAGDIGTGTFAISSGLNEDTFTLPDGTGYVHFRLTANGQTSAVVTSQQITIASLVLPAEASTWTGGNLYMWQNDAGSTQTDADNDPVGLILPDNDLEITAGTPRTLGGTTTVNPVANVPGIYWLNATSADRPTYDSATGLLDFSYVPAGTKIPISASLTGLSSRTSLYLAFIYQGTDNQFLTWANSSGDYGFIIANGNSNTQIFQDMGSPSIFIDTALQSSPTRDSLHDLISDGSLHLIELSGADLSATKWNTLEFGTTSLFSGFELQGLALPVYVGPTMDTSTRAAFRAFLKTTYPSLNY